MNEKWGEGVWMYDLNWKNDYLIHEDIIDKEHKKLFLIAKRAFMVVDPENKKTKIRKIVQELLEYTQVHFSHEEDFMDSINYPKLKEHQKIHQRIIYDLKQFISRCAQMNISAIEKELADFITDYVVNHIVIEDKKVHIWRVATQDEEKQKIEWKELYRIDHPSIDSEHKRLFEIAAKAFEKVEPEKRKVKIKAVVGELYRYMQEHFNNEQTYMQSIQYPDFDAHKALHDGIIAEINTFIKKLPSMEISTFERKLAYLIEIWLVNHIIQEDTKIMEWANSKGAIEEMDLNEHSVT